jgi:hypothetical protein
MLVLFGVLACLTSHHLLNMPWQCVLINTQVSQPINDVEPELEPLGAFSCV